MRQSKLGVFFAAAQTRVESRENLDNRINIGFSHAVQKVLADGLLMQFCGSKHSFNALGGQAGVVPASVDLGGDALDPAIARQVGHQVAQTLSSSGLPSISVRRSSV